MGFAAKIFIITYIGSLLALIIRQQPLLMIILGPIINMLMGALISWGILAIITIVLLLYTGLLDDRFEPSLASFTNCKFDIMVALFPVVTIAFSYLYGMTIKIDF